ncbi:site-specific DNA-methyltransferase [Flagellimonas marinaquae]|uniref:site-specific DNA-methyltransferase n=1 Tax=Flagellimonas marinaquae TaxID=254955 RepID=UPI000F8D8E44|nr:site-specific DNA-methyltransferase [Allomuricauda aquimarina]
MPTLHWIGKEKVVSHHQDVPYRVLEHKYTWNAELEIDDFELQIDDSKNHKSSIISPQSSGAIIHGDNLEALKSLLPEYEGKVKCIYIDPPYNTGNESWVYNDNVNHPKIKKWLGEVVGKDGEDLTRHDKWLCMMYPRLKLLHKLLADDGAIFISIDDNEQANLKLICDEIFGSWNYIATFPWRKRTAKSDVPNGISQDYEWIICYSKKNFFAGIESTRKYRSSDDYPNDRWRLTDLTKQTSAEERPNSAFDMVDPKTGKSYPFNPKRTWAVTKDTFQDYYDKGKIVFPDDYDFLNISIPSYRVFESEDKAKALKKYGRDYILKAVSTNLPKEVGMTQDGNKEIVELFGSKIFSFPKPSSLIQFLVGILNDKNSIILDSFAGSGTTAHAVLNLNKQDGGNRKFILVEMEDYANDITAERVKRVAIGYGKGNKKVEGTGGAFDFYELGLPLFDENQNLNEEVGLAKIREYIWFSETRSGISDLGFRIDDSSNPKSQISNHQYELGVKDGTVYYFIYEKDKLTTLDFDALELIKTKGEQYIIYADNCLLPKEFMAKKNIIFKKIPRDITRF